MNNISYSKKLRKYAKKMFLIRLLGSRCDKCGCTSYNKLCFHHLDKSVKEFSLVSKDMSISRLINEAKKCILLCHNCHRQIHENKPKQSKILLLNHKQKHQCENCGYSKSLNALEFHHIDPTQKDFQISSIHFNIKEDIPINIKNEIDKCIVLCSNCHNDQHFDYNFYNDNLDKIISMSNNIREYKKYDHKKILELFLNNHSEKEISDILKIPKLIIRELLLKNKLKTKTKIIDDKVLIKLHAEGLNSNEISKKLNKTQSSICRKLQKLKLIPNKRNSSNIKIPLTKQELENLLKDYSYGEIANLFGTTRQAIYKKAIKYELNK